MERVKGIEPSSSAWKAEVLPLNYTRMRYKIIMLYNTRTLSHTASTSSSLFIVACASRQLVGYSVEASLVTKLHPHEI